MTYPFYETDLRTMFERRPKDSLNLVLKALQNEANAEDAAEFLYDFVSQNYMDLIHSLFANNESDKNLILNVIAGMLASPQFKVVDAGIKFVYTFREKIFECLHQTLYAGSAGALLKNYMRYANVHIEDVMNDFTELFGPDFRRLIQDAQRELFWAAYYLEERRYDDSVSLDFVLEEISNRAHYANTKYAALRLLSKKFEEKVGSTYAKIAYRKLVNDVLLVHDYETKDIAYEALFALSNIVVEKGVPKLFLEDEEIQDHVIHLMRAYGKSVCDQGLWVFMNAIKTSTRPYDNPKVRSMLEMYATIYSERGDTLSHALNDIVACMKHTPTVSRSPSPPPVR